MQIWILALPFGTLIHSTCNLPCAPRREQSAIDMFTAACRVPQRSEANWDHVIWRWDSPFPGASLTWQLDPLSVRSDPVICPHRLNLCHYLLHIRCLQPICPPSVPPSLHLPLPQPPSVHFVSPSKGRLDDLFCGWIIDRCSLKIFVHTFILTSPLYLIKSAFKIPGKQLSFSNLFVMDSVLIKIICYTESSHVP